MKTCPIALHFCQSRIKISPNTKIHPKNFAQDFKHLAKVAKFRQIWSHWSLTSTSWDPTLVAVAVTKTTNGLLHIYAHLVHYTV